jgi:ADP-ribosylglycohydrolase
MKVAAEKSEAETSFLDEMFKDIYDYNKNSMANGSLMRISPFAFFFALIGEDPLKHAQFIKGIACQI